MRTFTRGILAGAALFAMVARVGAEEPADTAEAAAQHHFKKPASKLTRREASLLAASLPNPLKRTPGKPGKGLSRYANRIAARIPSTEPLIGCLGV